MFFSRIRCHFCGSKQPYGKDVVEFQCSHCEAMNFLDGKGNIVDTPLRAASPPPSNARDANRSFLSFTKPLPDSLEHQQQQAFCRTCTQNQHLYNRILAEYLPEDLEENTREYRMKMRALPAYKLELEHKYPQVCKMCAANAQSMINRADYYAMSQNAAKLMQDTRRRAGNVASRTRDSTDKRLMRNLLRLVEMVLFTAYMVQIAFHVYGILYTAMGKAPTLEEVTSTSMPSLRQCAQQTLSLTFRLPCYSLLGAVVPMTLSISAVLLWFHPGLKAWYHHTLRIEAVTGKQTYFFMQLIILAVRSWSWYMLSRRATIMANFSKEQVIAVHGFTVLFMLVTQTVANRNVQAVPWTMKGKIMPKPSEHDILGVSAGPASEHYTPKPSSKDPWKYLRRDESGSFDINNLAPKAEQPVLRSTTNFLSKQPSPEISDDDAMELDDRPVMRSSQRLLNSKPNLQPRNTYRDQTDVVPLGFNDVRNQLSGISSQEQPEKLHYQPVQRQSPFYGNLPPAPMSMERRLRNPVLRPAVPEQVPLSQQKDFMAQMRRGVKPVTFPEKGTNFQLKQSSWVLPGDVKEVGIEDRFTKSFSLDDQSPSAAKKGFLGGLFG